MPTPDLTPMPRFRTDGIFRVCRSVPEWQMSIVFPPHIVPHPNWGYFWGRFSEGYDYNPFRCVEWNKVLLSNVMVQKNAPLNTPNWAQCVIGLKT